MSLCVGKTEKHTGTNATEFAEDQKASHHSATASAPIAGLLALFSK